MNSKVDGRQSSPQIAWIIVYQRPQEQLNPYSVTYSIEPSPSWEANQFSTSQEFPRILSYPNTHCRIYKFPPPLPILSQINPVNSPTQLTEDPS